VGAAGVLTLSACGPLGGGSDGATSTAAKAAPAATALPSAGAKPAVPPAAALGAPASAADAAEITSLTRTVVLADKVGDICRKKLSAKFVSTTFRTVARCERTWIDKTDKDKSDDVTGVDLSNIRVSGSAATAAVTLHGGSSEGTSGTWAFLRDGNRWLLAAWGVDFLRSSWDFTGYKSDGPDDPLGYPAVQTCLTDKFRHMSDKAFEGFANAVTRDDKVAYRAFGRDVTSCTRVPDAEGVTTVRRLFEVGLKQGLEKQNLARLADCVTHRLRTTITDDDLVEAQEQVMSGGAYPTWINQRGVRAKEACASEPPTRAA
jgi:hypothetical protein